MLQLFTSKVNLISKEAAGENKSVRKIMFCCLSLCFVDILKFIFVRLSQRTDSSFVSYRFHFKFFAAFFFHFSPSPTTPLLSSLFSPPSGKKEIFWETNEKEYGSRNESGGGKGGGKTMEFLLFLNKVLYRVR